MYCDDYYVSDLHGKDRCENCIAQYIKYLEVQGLIDPNCMSCANHFYPQLRVGMNFSAIFAPRHEAMKTCKSGKYNHCTCDTCF
jgi:hypothetical protein